MLKTSVRILLLFLFTVCVALATGFATYTITRRVIAEQNAVAADVEPKQRTDATVPTSLKNQEEQKDTAVQFEYYIVRLMGDELGVYVSHSGDEEFLYTEKIYKNNLSKRDIELLESGVRLEDTPALTGFLENFTS